MLDWINENNKIDSIISLILVHFFESIVGMNIKILIPYLRIFEY